MRIIFNAKLGWSSVLFPPPACVSLYMTIKGMTMRNITELNILVCNQHILLMTHTQQYLTAVHSRELPPLILNLPLLCSFHKDFIDENHKESVNHIFVLLY